MVHRGGREGDYHAGKFNGLGGKLEPDEDIAAGMRRELREEAGIDAISMTLAGTISWPGFGKQGEDWFGFIFRIFSWTGEVAERSPEGPLEWIELSRVASLPLWEGDRLFLPYVFELTSAPFHGVMPYRDGKPVSWTVTRLSEMSNREFPSPSERLF